MKRLSVVLTMALAICLVASDSWARSRSGGRGGASSPSGQSSSGRFSRPADRQDRPSDRGTRFERFSGRDTGRRDFRYDSRHRPSRAFERFRGFRQYGRRRQRYYGRYPRHLYNFYFSSPYYGHVSGSGLYFYYHDRGDHHSLSLFFGLPICTFGYGCGCHYCTRVTHYNTYIVDSGFDVDYATRARQSYSYGFGGLNDDEKKFWNTYREQVSPEGEDADLLNLRFGEESQRLIAAMKLGESGNEGAVKLLKGSALNDESEIVRIQAIMSLGKIGDESAVPVLRNIAEKDKSQTVRAAALRALKKIEPDILEDTSAPE